MAYTSLKQVEDAFDITFNEIHVQHRYDENKVLTIFNGLHIPVSEMDMITHNIYGLYHKCITKDLDKMFEHFKISAQMGNMDAMRNISDNHIKYSEFESKEDIIDEIIFYYTKAFNNGDIYALFNLVKFYYDIQRYSDFYYYSKIIISNICKTSDLYGEYGTVMMLLGDYYKDIVHDYDKMKYVYKEAIISGNKIAIEEVSDYFDTIEIDDSNLKKDYFFDCMNYINSCDTVSMLLKHINPLELWQHAYESTNITLTTFLRNNPNIFTYITKCAQSKKYNIKDLCMVCHETKMHIPMTCGHYICMDCYINLTICPCCRSKF